MQPGGVGWGYARVSTERQFESGLGIRGYIEAILRYADAYGFDLGGPRDIRIPDDDGKEQAIPARERVLIDGGVSAFHVELHKRPAGKVLCGAVRPGNVVIFPTVDRGFRDTLDCLSTVKRWQRIGVSARFLDFGIDTSTEVGMMILSVGAALATMESRRKSERMVMAHRQARNTGRIMGNRDPDPGFTVEVRGGKRYQVPCQRELALIPLLVEMRNRGMDGKGPMPLEKIELKLEKMGIKTPDWGGGSRKYSRHRILGLIKAAPRLREVEELTGVPVGEADEAWLRAYVEADAARRDERERRKQERAQRKAFAAYQADLQTNGSGA